MRWKSLSFAATLQLVLFTVPVIAGTLQGSITVSGMRSNADAVVFIGEIPGKTFPPPAEPVRMDQVRMVFTPFVVAVQAGTTVDFLNSDPVAHNVFTVDACADEFDLGSWTRGEVRSYTFEKPCAAVVLCNIHPDMEAYVVAVPTPYFAVTDDGGSFLIEDLPDGTYTLKVWHPKKKETSQKVTVSKDTRLDLVLKR